MKGCYNILATYKVGCININFSICGRSETLEQRVKVHKQKWNNAIRRYSEGKLLHGFNKSELSFLNDILVPAHLANKHKHTLKYSVYKYEIESADERKVVEAQLHAKRHAAISWTGTRHLHCGS